MKKILTTIIIMSMLLVSVGFVVAGKGNGNSQCTTIQDGILEYSTGHYLENGPLMIGFDPYGYNYQAHMFKGSYANAYLGRAGTAFPPYEGDDDVYLEENPDAVNHWTWPYRNVDLIMKWNDAWLSNVDCDKDGKLDRYYIGSGAWLTNHQKGVNDDGTHWEYFTKIVAKPTDEFNCADIDGEEIWGSFCTIQTVSNDPAYDEHGVILLADIPGFGIY